MARSKLALIGAISVACAVLGGAANAAYPETLRWKLSEAGLGPIRIGMTISEASQLAKFEFKDTGNYDGDCRTFEAPELRQVSLMTEGGRITTISIYYDYSGTRSLLSTDRGIALGKTIAAVRQVYPVLKREADPNGGERYFFWATPSRGIKFDFDDVGVTAIEAGTKSIEYSEGCS